MRVFMEPEMDIIEFQVEDVITTSGQGTFNPIDPDQGEIM